MTCIPRDIVTYFTCILDVLRTVFCCILNPLYSEVYSWSLLLYSSPYSNVFWPSCISSVFSSVFRCALSVFYCIPGNFIFWCPPPTHPRDFIENTYFVTVFWCILNHFLRIRISRVFWAYSGVFSHNSRIRTEYGRSYLPKFYTFKIRQNTAYISGTF